MTTATSRSVKPPKSVAELENIATAQDWRVERRNEKVLFYPPDGPVISTPARTQGDRHYQNTLHRLIRNGLKVPGYTREDLPPDEEDTQEEQPEMDVAAVAAALEAAVQMVEELADQYATFRRATQESLMELRRDMQTALALAAPVPSLEDRVQRLEDAEFISAADFARRAQGIITEVEKVAAKADPIASFRARLKT